MQPLHDQLASYAIDTHWLNQTARKRTLLVVYAHPDDESFGNAGTIIRYSSAGVAVHYACATRGECGSVTTELLAGYANIAELRTAELDCAAQALGLAAVHYLGYRDSGMPGTADNQHPNALVQAPQERVTGQIVALIRALRPQVLLTFDPYGGYGHPDHIAIHHAARAACAAAGDPAHYPDQLDEGMTPWSPLKLYYPTFNTRLLKLNILMMRLLRRDPRRFGENNDIDLVKIIENTMPVTTTINSSDYLLQKEHAWNCHRSQIGGMSWITRLPTALRRRINGTEQFSRITPPWTGERTHERDLFAGIRDE
jgi:LmbE family N-acetylglucosaminyl deacetylase